MIELEIQVLAARREGLLIEVGRLAGECGYTLLRQRLVQDPHGSLLTMVVRGSRSRQRALRDALERSERCTSFELEPYVDGAPRAHFAATRKLASGYQPPPAPPVETIAPEPAASAPAAPGPATEAAPALATDAPTAATAVAPEAAPATVVEPEDYTALVVRRPARPPAAPEPDPAPYLEAEVLQADAAAVAQALATLERDYPRILPCLQALDRTVAPGARESSLHLAGQRVGGWLFRREYAMAAGLALDVALAAIAVPALRACAEAELREGQLHVRHSPLCGESGHSGCSYYVGFLEGLLRPALARSGLAVFPVCCRSYGADECVLAISE